MGNTPVGISQWDLLPIQWGLINVHSIPPHFTFFHSQNLFLRGPMKLLIGDLKMIFLFSQNAIS